MKAFDTLHIKYVTVIGKGSKSNTVTVQDSRGVRYEINKINIRYN